MRNVSLICAFACCSGWLVACGSSDSGSNNDNDAGLAGSTNTGGGGSSNGGTGGTTGGTGGTTGGTGGTTGGTGGTTGGTGGTTGGTGGTTGGTGGTTGGTGGTGGTAPNYCMGDYTALPYTIAADFKYLNEIGPMGQDYTMHIVNNPDCDGALTVVAADVVDGGSDGGVTPADGGVTPADGGGIPDASLPDGSVPPPADAGVDAGDAAAPLPACYEFDYNPTCTDVGNNCWGGVIFQANDQGIDTGAVTSGAAGPGICVATGATHITFEARASRATTIKFGSIRPGETQTEFWTPITTDWAQYTIAIPIGEPYNRNTSDAVKGVWNGFSVVAANEATHTDGGEVIVQVRNMVWGN